MKEETQSECDNCKWKGLSGRAERRDQTKSGGNEAKAGENTRVGRYFGGGRPSFSDLCEK